MSKYSLCPHCGQPRHWHTKKWYMENFSVNPERLDIEPLVVDNPYYKKSAPMKLYAECQVKTGIENQPSLIIKPRSPKQIEAAKRNALKLLPYVEQKAIQGARRRARKHGEYHERKGDLHGHGTTKPSIDEELEQEEKEIHERFKTKERNNGE